MFVACAKVTCRFQLQCSVKSKHQLNSKFHYTIIDRKWKEKIKTLETFSKLTGL